MINAAAEGKIAEVEYMFPRPGGTDPVEKVSYRDKDRQPDLRRRLLQVTMFRWPGSTRPPHFM